MAMLNCASFWTRRIDHGIYTLIAAICIDGIYMRELIVQLPPSIGALPRIGILYRQICNSKHISVRYTVVNMLLTMLAIVIHIWLKRLHDSGNSTTTGAQPLSNWAQLLVRSKSSIPWRIVPHHISTTNGVVATPPIDRNVENPEILVPTTITISTGDQWILAAIVARLLFACVYMVIYILLILILLT
jgi:hypothetical protein